MTATLIKFPRAGWARNRVRPVQRLKKVIARLTAESPRAGLQRNLKANPKQIEALKRKFAKGDG